MLHPFRNREEPFKRRRILASRMGMFRHVREAADMKKYHFRAVPGVELAWDVRAGQ
jgi:hypothetical protein